MSNNNFFLRTLDPKLITISLRRPLESTLVQTWTFSEEPIIKIGRASDNDVILHSSVVSRYHVELRYLNNQWKLISFGNNGTYLQGKLVKEAVVEDGTIIGLALSGPQLQINLGLTAQALNPNQVSVHHPLSNQSLGQPRNTFIREPDA